MKTHEFTLRNKPFRAVAGGTKTIEMRLFDEKRRGIAVGDTIRFTHAESGAQVTVTVVALHRFPDFASLYEAMIPRVGAVGLGYAPDEAAHPDDMLDYYPAEKIRRFGVVGIEIRLTQKTTNFATATASGEPLPEVFLARMEAALGEEFPAFLASFARAIPPSLRINPLKSDAADARDMLPYLGDSVPWQAAGFYYPDAADASAPRPGKHPLHEAGLYYIQEASAMLPASLCPPTPGERVLDLCAAPGGKATQLAGALGGRGLLVANEIHPTRATVLSQNLERMGVRNAVVTNASPDELALRFKGFFHKIVVDAPCSGEGMFRREADAVRMWSPANVALCAERQAGILDAAAEMLAPGGVMVYSTCTFAPAEDEGAVMDFLSRHPDFEVIPSAEPLVVASREAGILDGGHPEWVENADAYPAPIREAVRLTYRVLPHHAEGEGHFAALLRKRGDAEACVATASCDTANSKRKKGQKHSTKTTASALDAAAFEALTAFLRDTMGCVPSWASPEAGMVPCLFGERLYLVPDALGKTAADIRETLRGLHILRAGLCVGTVVGMERGRGRFEPDHAPAMAWSVADGGALFDLETEDAAWAYLRGETLPAPAVRGWHIVTFRGLPLGWGKASDGVMKNHYPKGLRK